eukprot:3502721-Amphidinium_carterae.2
MLSIPTTHQNKTKTPIPFEGNNKSDSRAGPTIMHSKIGLQRALPTGQVILDSVRQQTTSLHDETHADRRVGEEGRLSDHDGEQICPDY